ncbi:D-alanyl-D-alanine carboxypeptidase [Protaetiibacter sp. SSC-01]|uniref:D-alanyl-D-alanine carboxypeptidase n=1 Tax=Protaetiibacter sp. SSC-01 TaxID=2759943 RepID=UPI001656C528|nr:D-alanyl-D-alanine carboxypeptidase [Protaetiibacter sp. SSC-01]QNO37101.1 D-alanyl-D-alanine carboxypeptidase [Protaetiibacter sp. SSC-01]
MTDEQPISRRAAREAARGKGAPTTPPAVDADAAPAAAKTPGGIGALLRRHPVAWIVGASAVAFALLGTGAVFAGAAWASRDQRAAVSTPEPSAAPERPLPAELASATRLRTCSIAPQAADPRLGGLVGTVVRTDTGESLFDRSGAAPAPTSSAMKVLTAAAAISRLGPDFQVTTSVYEGSSPGTIVLVGRGDATLSALPAGQESFYPGAPKLQTLAETTIANYRAKYPDIPIARVVLDAGYWNANDRWDETWDRGELTRGTLSEVTALQVDGDRSDPRAAVSERSNDPVGRAGSAFIEALRDADVDGDIVAEDVTTIAGSAVGTTTLAEVKSQPIRNWISQMLLANDHTLAEMLARIVSRESDMGGSAASLQGAITGALLSWEIPSDGVTIRDGSGVSAGDAVPPQVMTALMRKVLGGEGGLDVVRGVLPVAGKSGTLVDRFTGDNTEGRDNVTGAAGSLSGASTLSGWFTAADGAQYAFSFTAVAEGLKASDARAALDTLTIAALRCGDNLSNN